MTGPGGPDTPAGPVDADRRDVVLFRREYAERRRRQALSVVPVGVLGVLVSAGGMGLPRQAGLFVVGAVVLGFFGYSRLNWRCPACDTYLGQRLNPRRCPSCGQTLRD